MLYAALPHGYSTDGWKERTVNAIGKCYQAIISPAYMLITAVHCHAGYTWQICWLFECVWQLLFLLRTPLGMIACMVSLFAAFTAMLYGLSQLYRYILCCHFAYALLPQSTRLLVCVSEIAVHLVWRHASCYQWSRLLFHLQNCMIATRHSPWVLAIGG